MADISDIDTDAPGSSEPPAIETLSDADFKAELTLVIPQLRAFGRSLSGNRDTADDLVQETLMKAWSARLRFQAGTNMRAWTFIILRNIYLSQMRRTRFTGNWDDLVADRILVTGPNQSGQLELADVQRGLQTLPEAQREALILVGAGGFSYEEAAEICGVAVGTIKSRVARGRVALEAVLNDNSLPSRRDGPSDGNALDTIIGQVRDLSGQEPDL
ncbi:MAG TPA: sigma-70 family RNA polymerase sigma factor [Sphingomonas sp.]|jgi:RNA polymerase sigma-70 factor (ECF subfamily)|nr:sigma-70 family RNA polymerase sigma factor [Sphingomonas sp.]